MYISEFVNLSLETMKDTSKQVSKSGGPSGDHGSAATRTESKTSSSNVVEDAVRNKKDKTKSETVKKTSSKTKAQKEKSQMKNGTERERKEWERRERERREWERYQRDVIEAERKEKELEFERWEREQARERERARRGKVPNAVSRYKPRKPPAGYKDPHDACKQVLPTKVKEEKRQEIKALMNCIAFDEESPSADGDKAAGKVKPAIEEMDNSMSSDTTSDMTDVTPRSSSSGCSSMSKQSVNYEKMEMSKSDAEGKGSENTSKRGKSKNESEMTVVKNTKKDSDNSGKTKGKSDNQEIETEVNEAELEEMKYLEDAFEDLDIDDQETDFASSIITGLSEERRAKCGRKNMTFTNEQLREIERVNLILLKKIMGQRKPRMKSQSQPPANRRTSAAINRSKMEERIERENKILLKKLQSAKGTTATLSRKSSQTQAYY